MNRPNGWTVADEKAMEGLLICPNCEGMQCPSCQRCGSTGFIKDPTLESAELRYDLDCINRNGKIVIEQRKKELGQ